MRILGLDVGDKTIGVAVSDELGIAANGVETIQRIGKRKDCDKVMDLINNLQCDTVVIGLNKMLDGSNSPQTEKLIDFACTLENKMRSSGMADIPVEFYDERFTTKIAEQVLIEGRVRREKRKDVIDKQAAVIILQGYLDSQKTKG